MEQSPLRITRSLPPPIRVALESLLGRSLKENESVSVRTYEPHDPPSDEVRASALEGLMRHFEQIDLQAQATPEEEIEEIIDEAMRSVRPGYRRVR